MNEIFTSIRYLINPNTIVKKLKIFQIIGLK